MRTYPETFRNPMPLHDRLKHRALEAGYENPSEYLTGLVRYDFLTRKKHALTAHVSKLSRAEQDKFDDETARLFDTGDTVNGSWFERMFKDVVRELGIEADDEKIEKTVEKVFARMTARKEKV